MYTILGRQMKKNTFSSLAKAAKTFTINNLGVNISFRWRSGKFLLGTVCSHRFKIRELFILFLLHWTWCSYSHEFITYINVISLFAHLFEQSCCYCVSFYFYFLEWNIKSTGVFSFKTLPKALKVSNKFYEKYNFILISCVRFIFE